MKTKIISYLLLLVLLISFSCTTDSLEPALEQDRPVEEVTNSTEDLKALILGAYNTMRSPSYYGVDFLLMNELRGTNVFANGRSKKFLVEGGLKYNARNSYIWDSKVAFRVIASTNLIIHADVDSFKSEKEEAKHVQGQAYAVRALVHFDLLKQYGQINTRGKWGVPYITEYQSRELYPAREEIEEVKDKILADLDQGWQLMSDTYFDVTKATMSRYTAKALEARVSLYFGDWDRAKKAAQTVIDSKKYQIIPASDFVASWLRDSNANSIFELAFHPSEILKTNSLAYYYRLVTPQTGYGDIEVLEEVPDIFKEEDVRKQIIGKQFGNGMLRNISKFPDMEGYNNIPLVRYEEVILTCAEAQFELGETEEAVKNLNLIATGRGVEAYTTISKEDILMERRKEFMFEGFIFDDLMRTRQGIPKMSKNNKQNISESIPYGDPRLALPIPKTETDANPNMVQNDGY